MAPGTANLTLHSEANVRCFLVIGNEAKVANVSFSQIYGEWRIFKYKDHTMCLNVRFI